MAFSRAQCIWELTLDKRTDVGTLRLNSCHKCVQFGNNMDCVHASGGQRSTSRVIPQLQHPWALVFFETGSLTGAWCLPGWPTSPKDSPLHLPVCPHLNPYFCGKVVYCACTISALILSCKGSEYSRNHGLNVTLETVSPWLPRVSHICLIADLNSH